MTTDLTFWTDQVNILEPVQWRRCWGFQVLTDQRIVLFRLKATLILVAVPLRPAMTCATFLFCVWRKGLFGLIAVKRSLKLDMLAFHNTLDSNLEGFLRYSCESSYCRCHYSQMFPTDSLEAAGSRVATDHNWLVVHMLVSQGRNVLNLRYCYNHISWTNAVISGNQAISSCFISLNAAN